MYGFYNRKLIDKEIFSIDQVFIIIDYLRLKNFYTSLLKR